MMYGRSQSAISEIVNWSVEFLDEKWKHLLDWDHQYLLSEENLRIYGQAIYDQGAPVNTVFGWPDCTKFFICRPCLHQRVAYNGHDRAHCLKFQAITLPNGIIANLYGPVEGRRHDMALWEDSGIPAKLAAHAFASDPNNPGERRPYQIYGDAAYGISLHVLIPFSGAGSQTEEELA